MALGVAACSDGENSTEKDVILTDQGAVCIDVADRSQCEPVELRSGQRLQFTVDFNTCLSSSCDRPGPTSCEVTRSGHVLEVTATGSYTTGVADLCTADCRQLTATCEIDALPDGDYEIRYDGNTLPITIPSSQRRTCTASSPFVSQCCDEDADCPGATCSDQHICNSPPIPGESDASAN